ncbi:MAG TPA: cyclic nucleotide-binding domain-containing protein [Treponemataceae bacterium]|nr:cyclic nucleotide-binding domain-containing protein [Treponemataceae bacterium]
MPRPMQYTKGSIIYFSGDYDERVFVIQKGQIILTSTDIETGSPVTEHLKDGEFFGVKSALGHFPREETATVLCNTTAIILTIPEFEAIFSRNKKLIMKMLKVFSSQLRTIHKKTESILHNTQKVSNQEGMIEVARSFFIDEKYRSCADICKKFLEHFPSSDRKVDIETLLKDSVRRHENQVKTKNVSAESSLILNDDEKSSALQHFSLPAFERFAKPFEPGQVIICEYEPGQNFYLIQTGQVQLVKSVNGTKKNIDILMPGEFFGEMAILDNSPRSATCVAINDVEVLEFNKENFAILVTGNPQIALVLLKLFCKRIYDQKRRFKTLCIADTQARICDVFLMFDEMNPSKNKGERSRRFNLTIQDISHWAALPYETVQDELSKLVEKNRLQIFETHMVVSNIGEMQRLVEQKSQQRQ